MAGRERVSRLEHRRAEKGRVLWISQQIDKIRRKKGYL
jgi:hypothetical protein